MADAGTTATFEFEGVVMGEDLAAVQTAAKARGWDNNFPPTPNEKFQIVDVYPSDPAIEDINCEFRGLKLAQVRIDYRKSDPSRIDALKKRFAYASRVAAAKVWMFTDDTKRVLVTAKEDGTMVGVALPELLDDGAAVKAQFLKQMQQ